MEKIIADAWTTVRFTAARVCNPISGCVHTNLPGFGYKVLGALGALLGYNLFVWKVSSDTEAWMFLEKLRLYSVGDRLVQKGFFMSDAEEADKQQEAYDHTAERLHSLWDQALAEATHAKSFDKLCEFLSPGECAAIDLPRPVSWRFSMMPYGRDDPDAKTFGFAPVDSPANGNTPLLDFGSPGDYMDRQDNKPNPIRKGRHMYTSAYLPPTK